jgi:hypothetical protein
MSQDHVIVAPKPLPTFLRVVCVALAILFVLASALNYFGYFPHQADPPYSIACVLFAPLPLSMAFISWPQQTPQLTAAITLGLFGFQVVILSGLIGGFAIHFPLLSLPAIIMAWLGIAMLLISDLLFVGAFGSTPLSRLRASA